MTELAVLGVDRPITGYLGESVAEGHAIVGDTNDEIQSQTLSGAVFERPLVSRGVIDQPLAEGQPVLVLDEFLITRFRAWSPVEVSSPLTDKPRRDCRITVARSTPRSQVTA